MGCYLVFLVLVKVSIIFLLKRNENLVKNNDNFPITQPIASKSIEEHDMYGFEAVHNRVGVEIDFQNNINLEPNLTINRRHQIYQEEEEEEDEEDNGNKKFTIL